MRSSIDFNIRKMRAHYGNLLNGQKSPQQPHEPSSWLANLGRGLKDNAALISALIALVGIIITQIVTSNNAQETLETQTNNAREALETQLQVEEDRAQAQQELEEDRAREAELQSYFEDMGEMLLAEKSPLPEAESGDPISNLAQAKTLTMLERLDIPRKSVVL